MFIFSVENKTMYFFLKYLLLLNEQRNGVSRSFLAQKRIVKLISFFFFRLNYVRYLQHSNTVAAACISRTTGDIATVCHSGKF